MNNNNNDPNHHAACDVIAAQIDPLIAGLKTAGYAANTLCTKRAALRRFLSWRRRLNPPGREPDESEVTEFMARSSQLGSRHRCLASTALSAFLEHLRRYEVITTCAPKAPDAVGAALEKRYADFLRNEKGLAELSLQVYLPLVPDLLRVPSARVCDVGGQAADVTHSCRRDTQLQTPNPPQTFNHHPNIRSPTSAANPQQAQSGRVQRRAQIIESGRTGR
jgi:hypothetical protein